MGFTLHEFTFIAAKVESFAFGDVNAIFSYEWTSEMTIIVPDIKELRWMPTLIQSVYDFTWDAPRTIFIKIKQNHFVFVYVFFTD